MAALGEWLFAAPWWLLATVGAGAVAMVVFAFARTDRRIRRMGILAVLAVAIWAAASLAVETRTEFAIKQTREMVSAYQREDWTRLGQLIDEETRFKNLLMGQEIVEAARLTQEAIGNNPLTITRIETRRDGVGILVILRVRTHPAQSVQPVTTAWSFDYRKLGDEWRLDRIEPLATEHIDPNTILRNVRVPVDLKERRR